MNEEMTVQTVAEAALDAVRKCRAQMGDACPKEHDAVMVGGLVLALESAYYSKYPESGPDSVVEAIALCRVGRKLAEISGSEQIIASFPKL